MSKVEKMKKEAEETAVGAVQQNQLQQDINDVHISFGALGALRLVGKFVGTSTLKVLQQVRDNKKYKAFGFESFQSFLEQSPLAQQYAGISYKTFNNLENQMIAEGNELYDLLNQFRIPISTRQLLAKNGEVEISLDGDNLKIGEETYDLKDANIISVKDVIKDLAKDNRKLVEHTKKLAETVESQKEELKTGAAEFEEKSRALEAMSEGSSYERALTNAVGALMALTVEANNLPLVVTQTRGESDVAALWQQMKLVRDALQQSNFVFTESVKTDKKGISDVAMQVITEDDDFGDEDEK